MVATAATSVFFPASLPSSTKKSILFAGGYDNLDACGITSSKPTSSRGLKVKVNIQTPPKINGVKVNFATPTEIVKKKEDETTPSPSPRTFMNQLQDWSVLLTAISTMFLAAEKQWMVHDSRPSKHDMLVDPFGPGRIVNNGRVLRQNFLIRSYEIGADRMVTIEALMNHLRETSINHSNTVGMPCDGFGSTPEMSRRNLIWVIINMQVLVDRYPYWGDVVQVDTWLSAHGKNGLRRDWLVRDCKTGETLTRATSVCVMMNTKTRRLSKIPEEARREIEPCLMDCPPVVGEFSSKLPMLDDSTADYIRKDLTPQWNDLDVNQHVNNVKYIGWILTTAPVSILESHELSGMTLEYRKECGIDCVLQSLTAVHGFMDSHGVECDHLLRLESGVEIMRGRTTWRPKSANNLRTTGQILDKDI